MKRLARALGWIVASLLLLLVAAVSYLAGTNAGLRWALASAEGAMAGKLQVGSVQGTLLRGMSLERVRFEDAGLTLSIERLQATWRPAALLHGTVRLDSLHAGGVRVRTRDTGQPQPQSEFPPEFAAPIGVVVSDGLIEDLQIRQDGQQPLAVDRIELDAALHGQRLRLARLAVQSPDLQLSAAGGIRLGGDYALDAKLSWGLVLRGEQWRGEGRIHGDRRHVELQHELSAPLQAMLKGEMDDVFDSSRWQARLDVAEFDADRLLSDLSAKPLPPVGRVELHAALHGDRNTAVLEPVQIRFPAGDRSLTARGKVDDLLSGAPAARLTLDWRNLQWPLQGQAQLASAQGSAHLDGGLENFQLSVDTRVSLPTVAQVPGPLQIDGLVRGQGDVLQIERLQARDGQGQGNVQLRGSVRQWRSGAPQATLDGQWQALQWPLQGVAQVASSEGEVHVEGGLDDYRFRTALQLSNPKLPASHWQLAGSGGSTEVRFQTIDARLLDGTLRGDGLLAWNGPLRWQFSLQAEKLDPGTVDPAWPGSLSGPLQLAGSLPESGPSLQLTLAGLQGTLRERNFRAEAKVALQEQRWQLEQFQLQSGEARLRAQGTYADKVDLSWKLDAAQLSDLLPDAKGSVHGSGSLQGKVESPRLQVKLDGARIRWRDYRVDALTLALQGGLAAGQTVDLDLRADKLSAAGTEAQRLTLTGSGSAEQHRLELRVAQTDGALDVLLAGGAAQQVWQGKLQQLNIRRPKLGAWSLQQPAPLTLAADHAALERACLGRQAAGLCFGGDWRAGAGWSGNAALKQLPLAALAELLPEGVALEGSLNGNAKIAFAGGALREAEADVRLSPGRLHYQLDPERAVNEAFGGGTLRVQREDQRLTGRVRLDLSGRDGLQGEVRVALPGNGQSDWSASALDGALELRLARLDLVEVFAPQLSGVDGHAQGRLTLAGTVAKPQLSGNALLQARQIEVPQLGTVLKDVELQVADAGAGALRLTGSAHSGNGVMRLDGRFEPQAGNPWRVGLHVTGERFLAMRNDQGTVYVSPDLRLEAAPKRIDLEGELTVPEAHLTPPEGRSAVKPSSDVVVVREDQPEAEKQAGWAVYAHLKLKLGDKVRFTGFGFDGKVAGSLELNDVPDKITTATGSLDITEASYTAYGKKLKVDRGRLTYSGNPVTDPGLDFVATRTVEDKQVGVKVSGTASSPTLELFSNPSMSDGDILAYLVLGRPLNSAGQADSGALMAAASSFGLAKGGALAESIGHQLGFQDVSVARDANSDQPWLTVGRYLSPKLYVSYGVGLFESGRMVRIRYDLTKHWKVQGESGSESSGADLLYTIER